MKNVFFQKQKKLMKIIVINLIFFLLLQLTMIVSEEEYNYFTKLTREIVSKLCYRQLAVAANVLSNDEFGDNSFRTGVALDEFCLLAIIFEFRKSTIGAVR